MEEQCIECGHDFDIHYLINGVCFTCRQDECENTHCENGIVGVVYGEDQCCGICKNE